MNGNRFLLDTNAIIALLEGKIEITALLKDASWVGISIISSIEFLAFSGLSPADVLLYKNFEAMITVCDLTYLNQNLVGRITSIRLSTNLKLPDCIVSATAIDNKAILVTRDKQLLGFKEIPSITW